MLIAIGVVAGVVAIGTVGLLIAGPSLMQSPSPDRICALDRKAVFDGSTIGRSAESQFTSLKARMQAELVAEKNRIDAASRGLPTEQAQQMLISLQQRVSLESSRLDTVRASAIAQVIERLSPTISRVGKAANCSAILDRSNFVDVGQARDLTGEIVKQIERDIPPLQRDFLEDLYKNPK
ncbi:MAG: OmpH family outer membrane protein [Rhizobiales bacterium]|nr:OmpH family outer membrane protein [Hyphomicrobiales bacterium]